LFKVARIFGLLNGKIQRILENKIVEKAGQEHGIGGILWERTKKAIAMGSIGMNESVDCNKSMGGIVNGIGGIVKIWTPSGKAIHVKIGTDHTDNCIVNAGYISLNLRAWLSVPTKGAYAFQGHSFEDRYFGANDKESINII
jgi:hypothetical protein